jgi:hypothetical protein
VLTGVASFVGPDRPTMPEHKWKDALPFIVYFIALAALVGGWALATQRGWFE